MSRSLSYRRRRNAGEDVSNLRLPPRSRSSLRSLDGAEAIKARLAVKKVVADIATRRRKRLGTKDTDASAVSSVNIDPKLKYSIKSDRSVPDLSLFNSNREKFE